MVALQPIPDPKVGVSARKPNKRFIPETLTATCESCRRRSTTTCSHKSSSFISWSKFAGPYIVPARDCPYRAPTLNTKPSIAPRLRQCPNWRFPGVDSHAVNARMKARCTIHQPYQHFDKISATSTYNFRKRTIAAGVLDFWPAAGIP
jgi:hypothetical protein